MRLLTWVVVGTICLFVTVKLGGDPLIFGLGYLFGLLAAESLRMDREIRQVKASLDSARYRLAELERERHV